MQVHQRLREITEQEIAVADLFRFPTIASLAQYLNQEFADDTTPARNATQERTARASARRTALARRKQVPGSR
jgi:hypothetical protein